MLQQKYHCFSFGVKCLETALLARLCMFRWCEGYECSDSDNEMFVEGNIETAISIETFDRQDKMNQDILC